MRAQAARAVGGLAWWTRRGEQLQRVGGVVARRQEQEEVRRKRRGAMMRMRGLSSKETKSTSGKEDGQEEIGEKGQWVEIAVDRSALVNIPGVNSPWPQREEGDAEGKVVIKKTKLTELARIMQTNIKARGPISVNEYMRDALSNKDHGFYAKQDVFGVKGSFTTAPEISGLFGKLLGVWCVSNWIALGSPSKSTLVELGPGRGTLMTDMLRTISEFPEFYKSLQRGGGVRMVEISPTLRRLQVKALRCKQKKNEAGARHLWSVLASAKDPLRIEWHKSFDDVAATNSAPAIVVAQEMLDALPVFIFMMTKNREIREMGVDVEHEEGEELTGPPGAGEEVRHHLRFVLNKQETPAVREVINRLKIDVDGLSPGDAIEVPLEGGRLVQQVTEHLARVGGGAFLVVDYGQGHPLRQMSLRGIKDHELIHPLQEPGDADLTTNVDFSFLRLAVKQAIEVLGELKESSERPPIKDLGARVLVQGPITQGEFLHNLQIGPLVEKMADELPEDEDDKLCELYDGLMRLTQSSFTNSRGEDVEGMGVSYKVMSVVVAPDGKTKDALLGESQGLSIEGIFHSMSDSSTSSPSSPSSSST